MPGGLDHGPLQRPKRFRHPISQEDYAVPQEDYSVPDVDEISGSIPAAAMSDAQLIAAVCAGETRRFEELMRRYNQRVYRVARAIVKDEAEAEDVMQQAYLNAFTHLRQFADRARFSTWLTRIVIHEALGRRRKARPASQTLNEAEGDAMSQVESTAPSPERQAYASELKRLVEQSVDALPDTYRAVFMLRDIEGLSTAETAEGLDLGEEAVKTRLHRARAILRKELFARAGGATAGAFTFGLVRCDRIVERVFAELDARG
jgi:RNA polymerase sigma-70 factor, ECF subfamily